MNISTRSKYFMALSAFVLMVSGSVIFDGCKSKNTSAADLQRVDDSELNGEQLIAKYCTKCHALAPANALTNDVWHFHTLPAMAPYVGISTYGSDYFKADGAKGISLVNWSKIVDYYKKTAPVTLSPQKKPDSLVKDWAGFQVKLPKDIADISTAYTTTVGIDPSTNKIYSADAITLQLYKWDNNLNARVAKSLPSPAIDIAFQKGIANRAIITLAGAVQPINLPNGRVGDVDLANIRTKVIDIETDISHPQQTSAGDFNKDGLTDYVVSASGKNAGSLLLLTQNSNHTFKRVNLKKPQGAVQTVIGDFNNDGWPDIMALFGLGDECLVLFTNNKKGGFLERQLLRFSPTNGSTSFQLADVDHDGKLDVIYTCGYNYRDSRIMKPYHGLYIYTNTGNWDLKQSYFYPINGCTKAIAADFDGDGDIDIAACAFFADLKNQPYEGFTYFEQDKLNHFKPHALPVNKYGRWFNMAIGDYNGDGKPDIVLANYTKGLSIEGSQNPFINDKIPLIVLENHNKK